eukprot:gene7998-12463_t
MKQLNKLKISEVKRHCEYFELEYKENETKKNLIEKINEVDDETRITFESTLDLELLINQEVVFDGSFKDIYQNNGMLYYFNFTTYPTELIKLQLSDWKIIEKLPIQKKNDFHLWRKGGKFFFYKDRFFYIDTFYFIIYEISLKNGFVFIVKKLDCELTKECSILDFKFNNIWFNDQNSLYSYDIEKDFWLKRRQFDHDYILQNIIIFKNFLIFPNVFSTKESKTIVLIEKLNKFQEIPYEQDFLKHLKNGNYFNFKDEILFVSGGNLFMDSGVRSNEIHIFDLIRQTHKMERIPKRIKFKHSFYCDGYLYFIKSNDSINNSFDEMKNYRVKLNQKRNFKNLFKLGLFSDMNLTNNHQQYKLHSFIILQFIKKLSHQRRNAIETCDKKLFELALEYMYQGSDIESLRKDQLKKLKNIFGLERVDHDWFLDNFDEIFENKFLTDFTIICKDKKIRACHQPVLYLKSKYFQKFMNKNPNVDELEFKTIPMDMMNFYLRYLYSGRINLKVDLNIYLQLIKLGEFFGQVDFIEQICDLISKFKLNKSNCFYLFQYFENNSNVWVKGLQSDVVKLIDFHFSTSDILRISMEQKGKFSINESKKKKVE